MPNCKTGAGHRQPPRLPLHVGPHFPAAAVGRMAMGNRLQKKYSNRASHCVLKWGAACTQRTSGTLQSGHVVTLCVCVCVRFSTPSLAGACRRRALLKRFGGLGAQLRDVLSFLAVDTPHFRKFGHKRTHYASTAPCRRSTRKTGMLGFNTYFGIFMGILNAVLCVSSAFCP